MRIVGAQIDLHKKLGRSTFKHFDIEILPSWSSYQDLIPRISHLSQPTKNSYFQIECLIQKYDVITKRLGRPTFKPKGLTLGLSQIRI